MKNAKIERAQKQFLKALKKKFSDPDPHPVYPSRMGDQDHPSILPRVKHYDIRGREYLPAEKGISLCWSCEGKEDLCTFPGRMVVTCMAYERAEGPQDPEDLYTQFKLLRNSVR